MRAVTGNRVRITFRIDNVTGKPPADRRTGDLRLVIVTSETIAPPSSRRESRR